MEMLIIIAVIVVLFLIIAAFSGQPEAKPSAPHYTQPTITGYVYIINNEKSFKDDEWVKIGMTTRSVKDRIKEFNTATPYGFNIITEIECPNPYAVEAAIHEQLKDYRMFKRKEFFKISTDKLIEEINNIDGMSMSKIED